MRVAGTDTPTQTLTEQVSARFKYSVGNIPALRADLPNFKYDEPKSWGAPGNTACDGNLCKCVCGMLDLKNQTSTTTCADTAMKERAALSCQVLNGVELTPPPNEFGIGRQASIVYTKNSETTRTAAFASLFTIMKPDDSPVTVLSFGGSEADNTGTGARTFVGADGLTAPQSMTLYPFGKHVKFTDKTAADPSYISGHEGFIASLRDAICAKVMCREREKPAGLEECRPVGPDKSEYVAAWAQYAAECVNPDGECPPDQQSEELGICVSPFGRDLLKALDGINSTAGNRELVITGHSLGGAIAQVAARFVQLKYPAIKIRLFPFAAPRALARSITDEMNGIKTMSRPYPETGWPNANLTKYFPGLREGPPSFESLPESGSEKQNVVARWIVTGDAVPALLPKALKCPKSSILGEVQPWRKPLYCSGAALVPFWLPECSFEEEWATCIAEWFIFVADMLLWATTDFEWEAGFVGSANRANFDNFELHYTGEGVDSLSEPTWAPASVSFEDVSKEYWDKKAVFWKIDLFVALRITAFGSHVRYVKWFNFWGTQDNGGEAKTQQNWNLPPSKEGLEIKNGNWYDGRANRVPWNFGNAVQNKQNALGTTARGNGMGQSCFQLDYQFNGILKDWNNISDEGPPSEKLKEGYENCQDLAKALGQDDSAKYVGEDWADETFSNSSTIRHWANVLTALDAAVGAGNESYNFTAEQELQNKPGGLVEWVSVREKEEGRPSPKACKELRRRGRCNAQRECGWNYESRPRRCAGAEDFCTQWKTELACGGRPPRREKCSWDGERQACRAVIPGTSGEFTRGCCLKGRVSGEPCSWPVPKSNREKSGCPSTDWIPIGSMDVGLGPAGTGVDSKS